MQSSMISKAINLLALIGQAKRPLTFTELVGQSSMSKSTVHRILGILMDEGMVQHHAQLKVYLLGRKAFDILRQAHSGYDLQTLATEGMLQLQKVTGLNVSIAVADGDFAVVLRAFDANDSFGGYSRPGLREPLHVCAAGKALVAYLPEPLFEGKFEHYDFFSRSPQTITSLTAFRADLEQARARGYAKSDLEEYDYIRGIAAHIFNYVGEVIASINIWGTSEDIELPALERFAPQLMSTTRSITSTIGGDPSKSSSFQDGASGVYPGRL